MSYEINAWVEDGAPRLQILEADSRTVRLAWRAAAARDGAASAPLKTLFRELMLLSLTQQLQRNISQDT